MKLNLIEILEPILKEAGDEILKIYNSDQSTVVDHKADNSPLTLADVASNDVIIKALESNFDYPIISEENEGIPFDKRKDFDKFWCVDPLDGTKEFINRNGEFTVNIALIEKGVPVFGGIYVPVTETYYFGIHGEAAYKKVANGSLKKINVNQNSKGWIAVGSKSHAKPVEKEFYKEIGVKESFSVGSSLKFCMVAEGSADLYYRSGPTMEWDIAAGHAIVRAAGGEVYQDLDCKDVFTYNKEDLLNGPFLATSTTKLK
ncbi:MAG: 3'(2'), 5'-bisphosphate nucleotidase [Flavobacteriales bacterium]|jgi:3'(2'), 5'-bisphosphate nucleotidase|tara:strand:- start:3144 stop:3920 length:777 start_codon:yes stop_codon:yes gene_type:complete